jgi:NADH-quinone oxidoreductase subunit C
MTEPQADSSTLTRLVAKFGDDTVVVKPAQYLGLLRFLHDDPECDFDFLTDLAALDRLKLRLTPRYEVVLHLYSLRRNTRLRLKTRPVSSEKPEIPSIVAIYPAANWAEREAWDMFGITFTGHPDLRRILMYEEFEGHPLRKDYPVNKRQPLVKERELPDDRPGMNF